MEAFHLHPKGIKGYPLKEQSTSAHVNRPFLIFYRSQWAFFLFSNFLLAYTQLQLLRPVCGSDSTIFVFPFIQSL
jgi:hypothetical protein